MGVERRSQFFVSIPKKVSVVLRLTGGNFLGGGQFLVSIPKRVSVVLRLVSAWSGRHISRVSIPKRVSVVLRRPVTFGTGGTVLYVSIPKRVSVVLRLLRNLNIGDIDVEFQSLKGFQ